MEDSMMKKRVKKMFQMNGLSIKSDGINHLHEMLKPLAEDQHQQWMKKLIETLQKLPLSSSVIGESEIEKAAVELYDSENDDIESLIHVIGSNKMPQLIYNVEKKKFIVDSGFPSLHGLSDDKTTLFLNRYTTVYQRTIAHELFRKKADGADDKDNGTYDLVKVEYLQSLGTVKESVVVLGMLTRLTEGEYHVEDDTGFVKVELSNTKFHNGLFTVNCFVLVEGCFEENILHCKAIGLPPAQTSEMSRALMGNVNYFSNSGLICEKYNQKLQKIEAETDNAMIVFLSDVWLDKIMVMDKLQALFRGYATCPPVAFIFCGNFLSQSFATQQEKELKSLFGNLADILINYPSLIEKSKFIFIPGPSDPGPGAVFPRPPLSKMISSDFCKRIPSSIFTTNPCRISYCTQEIVVFREDIFTKMCRNSVYFPADSNIADHFARTLVSQAHLSPLPLHTVPVYWGLDHCLSLHPTPDLIITADRGDPFCAEFNSALVVNPGSFVKTDFSFKVHLPREKEIEDSQITDDM